MRESSGFLCGVVPTTLSLGLVPWISNRRREARFENRAVTMSDPFWLINAQMVRLEPFFQKSQGKRRVDDPRVLSGTIFMNPNGLK
jgi:hypothetical protein